MRQVYVNGQYLPEDEAKVSVFDRGFLFADAIYEVTAVLDGKLIDFPGHLARLRRSLTSLEMSLDLSDEELLAIHRKLVADNDVTEGLVYMQISRGAADRDLLFPPETTPKTVVLFTQKKNLVNNPTATRGIKVITVEDLRWRNCDIKTVQLLYASIAKEQAHKKGVDDAWMVLDGSVTEGSSNNAYIVTADDKIVTRQLSKDILHGITRKAVLACAADLQMVVEERPFTVEEAKAAREAFSTSATAFVNPVVEIDGVTLGDGKPGPVATRLRQVYLDAAKAAAI